MPEFVVREPPAAARRRWRRRRFLVDRRHQLGAAAKVAGLAVGLLAALDGLFLLLLRQRSAKALDDAPELAAVFRAQDLSDWSLMLLASLVIVVAVFLLAVLETHRTAGAAVQLARRLDELAAGRLGVQARLRRNDHLRTLEAAFNRASAALLERETAHARIFDDLARRVDEARRPEELPPLGRELQRLADELREKRS